MALAPFHPKKLAVLAYRPKAYCAASPYGGGYRVVFEGSQISETCRTAGGAWRSALARLNKAKAA